jgi:hypothetical protein
MLQNTYTTDELVERLGLMRKYYDKRLFQENKDITMREVIAEDCDEHTLKSLETWNESFKTQGIQPLVVYEALEAVQEDLSGLPSVTLYVPVRFSPEQIEKLGIWFRDNIQPNMLMSLHVDPRATGGCGFIWKDVYYDFSLRYFMEKQREEINKVFNTYTHAGE